MFSFLVKTVTVLVTTGVLLQVSTALADDPISVEIELNKKEYLAFEPLILTITIRNISENDIALSQGFVPEIYRHSHRFTFLSTGVKNEHCAELRTLRGDCFFVLRSGKYITTVANITDWHNNCRFRANIPEGEWGSLRTVLKHEICKEDTEKYKQFVKEKDVTAWQGDVRSNCVKFKFVAPRNIEEARLQDEWHSRFEDRTDNVVSYFEELFRGNIEGMYKTYQEHPILDYWFWQKNRPLGEWWLPPGYKENSPYPTTAEFCEIYIDVLEEILARRYDQPEFNIIREQLLWNKMTLLYVQDCDYQAEIIKEELVEKEPDRDFQFELKRLDEIVERLKEALKYERKEQERSRREVTDTIPEHADAVKTPSGKQPDEEREVVQEKPETASPRSARHEMKSGHRPPSPTGGGTIWLTCFAVGLFCVAFVLMIALRARKRRA